MQVKADHRHDTGGVWCARDRSGVHTEAVFTMYTTCMYGSVRHLKALTGDPLDSLITALCGGRFSVGLSGLKALFRHVPATRSVIAPQLPV